LDLDDEDDKKKREELKAELEPLTKLMKEVLGDKVVVCSRLADSPWVLATSGEEQLRAEELEAIQKTIEISSFGPKSWKRFRRLSRLYPAVLCPGALTSACQALCKE
jgi:HSP90 family molecular chaperone